MAVRGHGEGQHPRRQHRVVRVVWLRDQLEQGNRSVSLHPSFL